MSRFRVAWETFVGLVTGEDLLTGTAPPPDEGGNGKHHPRRKVSPATLARLRAQSQRMMRGGRVRPPATTTPVKEVVEALLVERDDEAVEVLRMMGML